VAAIAGMFLPRFEYEAPESLDDVVSLIAGTSCDAFVLAGGTDLLVRMKRGQARPRLIVSLRRVPSLSGIERMADGGLRILPLTTMSAIAGSALMTGPFVALAEGAAVVGGPAIRNRATVGGNIVSARPCADTMPPLVALGASVRLVGSAGGRTASLEGFISGPGQPSMGRDEILAAIDVPAPPAWRGSCYLKLTRRAAMEVTVVGCAASVDLEADRRTVARVRVVLASVAPTPLRAREAEDWLVGQVAEEGRIARAARAAADAARPIDDCRATAAFRRQIVEVLARRALTAAIHRATGEVDA
jgi:carbon-monoxide dehydrogenase medium subunit